MERLSVAIDDAIYLPGFGDAVMRLTTVAELDQRTVFRGLCRVENDQLGGGPYPALGISWTSIAIGGLYGKRPHRQHSRYEHRR